VVCSQVLFETLVASCLHGGRVLYVLEVFLVVSLPVAFVVAQGQVAFACVVPLVHNDACSFGVYSVSKRIEHVDCFSLVVDLVVAQRDVGCTQLFSPFLEHPRLSLVGLFRLVRVFGDRTPGVSVLAQQEVRRLEVGGQHFCVPFGFHVVRTLLLVVGLRGRLEVALVAA